MKRILKYCITSLLLMFSGFPSAIFAEEEFPYDGTYLTEENYAIQGFVFDQEQETITILIDHSASRLKNRVSELMNFNYAGYYEIMLDSKEAETYMTAMQNEPIIYDEILKEVADEIEPWMTRTDVFKLIDQQMPGLHFYPEWHNFNEAMIVQPIIETSQNLWIISTQARRILRFEINDDLNQITDDYQVTYTKVEAGEAND